MRVDQFESTTYQLELVRIHFDLHLDHELHVVLEWVRLALDKLDGRAASAPHILRL
jgi:hypothetical protein